MSTTIKNLTKKLKISRTGVEMRMSRIPNFRKKYTHHKGNQIIITDQGERLISNMKSVKSRPKSHNNDNVNDVTVNLLKKMLKSERVHNAQLQKQLDNVNDSHKQMEKLLNQQQQLQLSTQHENNQLKGQIKHIKAISGPADKKPEEKGETVRKPKLSFWQRLFGNH